MVSQCEILPKNMVIFAQLFFAFLHLVTLILHRSSKTKRNTCYRVVHMCVFIFLQMQFFISAGTAFEMRA